VAKAMGNPIREDLRTEHLVLLIGSNPLPNYIAAHLLWRRFGDPSSMHLVYSSETLQTAKNLARQLGMEWADLKTCLVNESDVRAIYEGVQRMVQPLEGSIGLHYTGGTKAMAVHAYRAVNDAHPGSVFSYLDARTLEIVLQRGQGAPTRAAAGLSLQVGLEEMLLLHGYHYHQKGSRVYRPEPDPRAPDFLRVWAAIPFDMIHEWAQRTLMVWNGKEHRHDTLPYARLANIPLPHEGHFNAAASYWTQHSLKTMGDAAQHFGLSDGNEKEVSTAIVKWLHYTWLEDFVLMCVRECADMCQLHEWGKNIEPYDPLKLRKVTAFENKFEFDVYAVRGWQLFGISVTTEAKLGDVKRKLFEAYVRARQIGGDEARTGLACMISESEENGRPMLKRQLKESWDAASNLIATFGEKDMRVPAQGEARLVRGLKNWFLGRVVND